VVLALTVAFAGLVALGIALLVTSPGDEVNRVFSLWIYQALVVLSVAIAAARAISVRRDRLAWSVIAFSLACSAFAEIYYEAFEPEAYPSIADVAWLAFYPVLYVGMVLLVRKRARSIAACDAYIAMTSSRPFRLPRSSEDALAELERAAGTQFDPNVVRVLAANVRDGQEAEDAA